MRLLSIPGGLCVVFTASIAMGQPQPAGAAPAGDPAAAASPSPAGETNPSAASPAPADGAASAEAAATGTEATPAAAATPATDAAPAALPPIPSWRLVLNNLFVVRYNPLGLEDQIRFGVQKRLYESERPIARDNFVHLGIYPKINPAYIKVGPSLEIQPLTIFNLRAAFEYMQLFSTFGMLQSFSSPAAEHSETALNSYRDNKLNYATGGMHFMLDPFFQIALGPIAVRNKLRIEYWKMGVKPPAGETHRVWYDTELDTLVPADGWIIANELDVLYVLRRKWQLAAGVRYVTVQPLYSDRQFATAADRTAFEDNGDFAGNASHRIGPIAAFTFFDDGYTAFNKPTILLIANWYLKHRNRAGKRDCVDITGQCGASQGIPYLALGFAFQSDFLK
jgi:hypothetical protein